MAFGFLITSNLPDLISLSSLCLFLCLDFYLFYFLLSIFACLNYLSWPLISSFYFLSFIFSSHVSVAPRFLQLRLGLRLAPTFHDLLLLFMPSVNLSSVSLISSGWGKASYSINNHKNDNIITTFQFLTLSYQTFLQYFV